MSLLVNKIEPKLYDIYTRVRVDNGVVPLSTLQKAEFYRLLSDVLRELGLEEKVSAVYSNSYIQGGPKSVRELQREALAKVILTDIVAALLV